MVTLLAAYLWCLAARDHRHPGRPSHRDRAPDQRPRGHEGDQRLRGRLLSRRDLPLRDKTLYRMLYETVARAAEILARDVQDLDLQNRRVPLTSKGGDAEWVYRDAGTARLLPRLLRLPDGHPDGLVRTRGPSSSPTANPSSTLARAQNICPHTGRPRLGYDRVRVLMEQHIGLDPHQLPTRHPPRRGEGAASAHHGQDSPPDPRTAMRYTRPGGEAVAEITAIIAPPTH